LISLRYFVTATKKILTNTHVLMVFGRGTVEK
jgi:hypothetical protein